MVRLSKKKIKTLELDGLKPHPFFLYNVYMTNEEFYKTETDLQISLDLFCMRQHCNKDECLVAKGRYDAKEASGRIISCMDVWKKLEHKEENK